MMLSLSAAMQQGEDPGDSTPSASAMAPLARFVKIYAETSRGEARTFVDRHYRGFFSQLAERQLAEAYLWIALSSLELEGSEPWGVAHSAEIETLRRELAAMGPAAAGPPPSPPKR